MKRSITVALFGLLGLSTQWNGSSRIALGEEPAGQPLPLTVFRNLAAGKSQVVIVYGTSLTAGGAWAIELKSYFEGQFPGQVTFTNAAVAGVSSKWGRDNVNKRVADKKPDLVFLEFSVNDAATKNNVSLAQSRENLDTIVKAIRRQNPAADIVLQTMDQAWDAPDSKKKYGSDRPDLSAYYEVYRQYARDNRLPLVDHYPTWLKLREKDKSAYEAMVPDGIHPSKSASLAVTWPAVKALLDQTRTAVGRPQPASTGPN